MFNYLTVKEEEWTGGDIHDTERAWAVSKWFEHITHGASFEDDMVRKFLLGNYTFEPKKHGIYRDIPMPLPKAKIVACYQVLVQKVSLGCYNTMLGILKDNLNFLYTCFAAIAVFCLLVCFFFIYYWPLISYYPHLQATLVGGFVLHKFYVLYQMLTNIGNKYFQEAHMMTALEFYFTQKNSKPAVGVTVQFTKQGLQILHGGYANRRVL